MNSVRSTNPSRAVVGNTSRNRGSSGYLYYFTGTWVDLDERKRPKSVPKLAGWATPAGWLVGLRPSCADEQKPSEGTVTGNGGNDQQNCNGGTGHGSSLVREIEQMEQIVGKRMYRGLLKAVARVRNPNDIQDPAIRQKVLAHMQAAERGFRRAQTVRDKAGLANFAGILGSLKLSSLDQVDSLKTLQEIVVALEVGSSQSRE